MNTLRKVLTTVALLAVALPAAADAAAPCEGRYLVVGEPIVIRRLTITHVTIADGSVHIADGCELLRARSLADRKGTLLRAAQSCEGVPGRVTLRGRIDPACETMRGIVRAPRADFKRRFRAVRESVLCRTHADCAPEAFCARPAGTCDGPGACRPRPAVCPDVFDPVCGCDGATYGNACEAAAAGANVRHRGECRPRCGTIAGLPCPPGEFCELPPGTCDSADLEGVCVPVPDVCPEIFRPVCGCDGITYENDCARRHAGAKKSHDGPCDARCETACDCYRLGLRFREPCPMLCPMCGNYWACLEGRCVEQCGPFPPGIGICLVEPAR